MVIKELEVESWKKNRDRVEKNIGHRKSQTETQVVEPTLTSRILTQIEWKKIEHEVLTDEE